MVGSVGVIATPGFGFVFDKVLERLGVERRRYVAGERKAELMDPFSPAEPEAVQRLLELQRELHDVFKDVVRERRGRALAAAETPEEVWADGEVFAGDHAVRIGLADDVGGMHATMRSFFVTALSFARTSGARRGCQTSSARQLLASAETWRTHRRQHYQRDRTCGEGRSRPWRAPWQRTTRAMFSQAHQL